MAAFEKKRIRLGDLTTLTRALRDQRLHTVCEGARCPNIGECFARGTATFLIAGNVCTRGCSFCAVTPGTPAPLDDDEPRRVARAITRMDLRYAVITSVTRDDLPDGAARHFAATIAAIRESPRAVPIEVLVPDFGGAPAAIATVINARPAVFAHNLETVPRLYPAVRAGGDYQRSLSVLRQASAAGLVVKSGIMLGMGEHISEVHAVMDDLLATGCAIVTFGQYLAPSRAHYPVRDIVPEDTFTRIRQDALARGFRHCVSGTYVRSSYHAESMGTTV